MGPKNCPNNYRRGGAWSTMDNMRFHWMFCF
jgi:hypothetical protein